MLELEVGEGECRGRSKGRKLEANSLELVRRKKGEEERECGLQNLNMRPAGGVERV